MTHSNSHLNDDPFDLNRFLQAQKADYETALQEIRAGQKRSHWIWYIFPQFEGLGFSSTSQHYAIKSAEEAKAYLVHPNLGARLLECAEAVLAVENRTATEIFGSTDAQKLKSCATLFAQVSPSDPVFERLIEKYSQGQRDQKTLELLNTRS